METVVTLPVNCNAPPAPPPADDDVAPRFAAAGPPPLFAAAAVGGVADGVAAGPVVAVVVAEGELLVAAAWSIPWAANSADAFGIIPITAARASAIGMAPPMPPAAA
jgi:hypothetical protein